MPAVANPFPVQPNSVPSGSSDNSLTAIDCYNYPFPDLHPIPVAVVDELISRIADCAQRRAKLFIHCTAGQNRSPTVIWLFYLACGIPEQEAREMITDHTLDAVPGHPALLDQTIIATAIRLGKRLGLDSGICR